MLTVETFPKLQVLLAEHNLDGWLLYDFRGSNPIARAVLGDSITRTLAHFFVHISSPAGYPAVVAIYSFILGMFVPSGGGKWVIEAPYVLQAAKDLHVNLGWIVQIYNASEALPNLINPFWMLPLIGILKMKARDLVGYGLLQLAINSVLVFFLMWFLARTFTYIPPVLP